jgi:hypothetical protein
MSVARRIAIASKCRAPRLGAAFRRLPFADGAEFKVIALRTPIRFSRNIPYSRGQGRHSLGARLDRNRGRSPPSYAGFRMIAIWRRGDWRWRACSSLDRQAQVTCSISSRYRLATQTVIATDEAYSPQFLRSGPRYRADVQPASQ